MHAVLIGLFRDTLNRFPPLETGYGTIRGIFGDRGK